MLTVEHEQDRVKVYN